MQRATDQHQYIQIIYLGSNSQTTRQTLRPLEITGDRLKAYCLTRRAPSFIAIGNIFAVQPVVIRHAV
ncbi:WYL domain-containing protein [Brevibacillus invocatus]|nr:WYL domain-containing protein [Brevibacillus invocatus]